MKKLVAVLLVFFIVMGSVSLMAQAKPRLEVDLKQLKVVPVLEGDKIGEPTGQTVKNGTAFSKNYADLMILLPTFPASIKWSDFDRVIIMVKFFDANGNQKNGADGMGMVTILYDPANGDIRGPKGGGEGPGSNNPLKTYNLGGYSSNISQAGSRIRMDKAPGGILIQNSNSDVKFIEVTEITFFKN
jgi:hypothetical protein